MSKAVLGWIVGGIVVIGGGYFLVTNNSQKPEDQKMEMTDQNDMSQMEENDGMVTEAKAGSYSGTFADLTKRGGDWVCSVDHTTVVSDTDGIVYISGKDIKGEFSVDAPYVGNVKINMIADGSNVYTWSSMMPQGVKAPQSKLEGDTSAPASGQMMDANQVLNYDCQPWSRDASKFTVPSISFMEVGQ